MPILIDGDLVFADGATPRPAAVVNRWLRELPVSGCRSPRSWEYYARSLRSWMVFLHGLGIAMFDTRARLRSALSCYAQHRSAGPVEARLQASTWGQHMSILGSFYRWAIAEGHASAEPLTYRTSVVPFGSQFTAGLVNQAVRRIPLPHVTISYLEADFADMFIKALGGLTPDGRADTGFRGRHVARNAAIGAMALATGLRLQEFTWLLVYEIPPLPPVPVAVPITFAVPSGITKGRKFRTTWISYQALAAVHHYIDLDRSLAASQSSWVPQEPLVVEQVGHRGALVNGTRVRWDGISPEERARLVLPGGGSPVLALTSSGGPFVAWASLFDRTAQRIRRCWESRFPHVHPHLTRHTFAMATLELLVAGYYQQAAQLVKDTDADAALMLYLSKADPLMVLRDLLGHASVVDTEKYLRRLDTSRIYRDAYLRAGATQHLADMTHDLPTAGGDLH